MIRYLYNLNFQILKLVQEDHRSNQFGAAGFLQFYKEYAIPADSFAWVVTFAISQPDEIDINEILYRPTKQGF